MGSYSREVRFNGQGITASGKSVRVGYAAADRKIFPFGTILYVPGHGSVVVEDTGGRIKGRRLDIFVGIGDAGRERAQKWENQILRISVLRLGEKNT